MKIEELRNQTKDELKTKLDEARRKLGELRFNIQLKQSKNVREVRKTKKLIAQILTILRNYKSNTKVRTTTKLRKKYENTKKLISYFRNIS